MRLNSKIYLGKSLMKISILCRKFDELLERKGDEGIMKCFVAVTRLINIKQQKNCCKYYFHFRGIYQGLVVKGLVVDYHFSQILIPGDDYLLYLSFKSIEQGFIQAHLIKVKSLKSLTC